MENNETFEKVEIFDSPEALAASMAANTTQQEEAPQQEPSPVVETTEVQDTPVVQESVQEQTPAPQENEVVNSPETTDENNIEYSDQEIEGAIANFVEETGRSPQDWFNYQALNPSEMDDVTAVRVSMAADYPNLDVSELDTLISSKYKTDSSLHTEEEIRISSIQMKVDAQNAREKIDKIRSEYAAPEQQQSDYESPIDQDWVNQMSEEVDSLEGLEFDLGNGQSFVYGLDDQYKDQLKQKNARLDEYFDDYIYEDGTWDYDTLSTHRAVIDNIDSIISNAYKQGLGDGQKGLVHKAANVQTKTPNQGGVAQSNGMAEQIKNIMRNSSSKVMFNPNR